MQTGYILCFFIVPISLEGCCVGKRLKKRTGLQQDTLHQHYRAVEGEVFIMPCIKSVNPHMEVLWTRTGDGREGKEGTSFICGREFLAETKHSGKYTCSGSELFLHLQVVERIGLGCLQPWENSVWLRVDVGGEITCPGLNCSDNTNVIWYKRNKPVSGQNRDSYQKSGRLHLCQVRIQDTGVYFCDRQIIERGVNWTFRRAVNVTAIRSYLAANPKATTTSSTAAHVTSYSPLIVNPEDNTTDEVELGRSHTLMCKVYFLYEINVSPEVNWYISYGGDMENMTQLHMDVQVQQEKRVEFHQIEVTRTHIIKEVTPHHLNHMYTCIASNTVNSSRVTIKLKEKIKVKWPSLVGYHVVSLLLVAGLGIVLHVKWLEIQLIYRSHFQRGNHDGDEKEFDVFLSYVWSPPSAEVEGVLTLSSQKGPGIDEEACLSSMGSLDTEEGEFTQRPLELLLPQMLEDQWGYRLCLLERDVLPGGAYTNDVVLAMQRSQMLVCLLSADYLSNSNAVFVLESGVQALLKNSILKLLLIWPSRASASAIQPDPPLPTSVQRALKVLPSLDWTSDHPSRAASNFWRSLRKAMPNHRVKLVSLMQDQ